MAKKKRTNGQRERDLAFVADHYLKGKSIRAIAKELHQAYYEPIGESISHQQVHYDIKKLHGRWLKSQLLNFNDAKARELARVDKLEEEAWSEYERSKRPKERQTVKGKAAVGQEKAEQVEKTEMREGRLGNTQYLQVIQWCIDMRCKILGVYAAAKIMPIDYSKLTTRQLRLIADGQDPYMVLASTAGENE